jgi:hypothetical protein
MLPSSTSKNLMEQLVAYGVLALSFAGTGSTPMLTEIGRKTAIPIECLVFFVDFGHFLISLSRGEVAKDRKLFQDLEQVQVLIESCDGSLLQEIVRAFRSEILSASDEVTRSVTTYDSNSNQIES